MSKKQKNKHHILPLLVIFISGAMVVMLGFIDYWYNSQKAPNLPGPPLKTLAAKHHIQLGVHTLLYRYHSAIYTDIATSQFSFITIDGEAHFNNLHPTSTTYDFTKADQMVAKAKANNMSVQLHHIVWGEANLLPAWLKDGNYNSSELVTLLQGYVTTVVQHYKGQIATYTVVNEPFTRSQHVYGLKDWWADHTGSMQYIDDSFKWAHQADPSATLLVNDFDNETENPVSNAEYSYVKAALTRGVPIGGIGMQMHIQAENPPNKADVIKNMQRFGSLGLPVYVTEFDVNVNKINGTSAYKSQLEAQITYNMVRACIESKICVSFDEFGITDKEDILKTLFQTNSHSYLFDSRYQPKPSFWAFRQAWLEP